MLINFFLTMKKYKVPVTIRELMDLLEAIRQRVVYADIDDFYLLSRTCLCKDEKHYDKFDRAFSAYFKGLEDLHGMLQALNVHDHCLPSRSLIYRSVLSRERRASPWSVP